MFYAAQIFFCGELCTIFFSLLIDALYYLEDEIWTFCQFFLPNPFSSLFLMIFFPISHLFFHPLEIKLIMSSRISLRMNPCHIHSQRHDERLTCKHTKHAQLLHRQLRNKLDILHKRLDKHRILRP